MSLVENIVKELSWKKYGKLLIKIESKEKMLDN